MAIGYLQQEEQKARLEHRDILLAIRSILTTAEGKQIFKYLFKHFQVGDVPDRGVEGMYLHDLLGFWRAGNSIFKLVSEADVAIAAELIAQIERDKYAELYKEQTNGQN